MIHKSLGASTICTDEAWAASRVRWPIIGVMAAADPKPSAPVTPPVARPAGGEDKVLCERCGVEMFRMHAVWRCPSCGFKTDCCGW